MPKLTYDIGYYGKVKIQGKPILATGGGLSLQYSPIFTSGVWGASAKNATQQIAYAPNYVSLSTDIGFQLTKSTCQIIRDFAFDRRDVSSPVQILPNGIAGYTGLMFCTGAGFSTSQDSLVTGNVNVKTGSVSGIITGLQQDEYSTKSDIASISPKYNDVYPYWASMVYLNNINSDTRIQPSQKKADQALDGIVDWNASYSSQLVLSAVCSGKSAMIQADYCALGTMSAQGSFTCLGIKSYLQPENIQKHNTCKITMQTCSGEGKYIISYGAIIWTSASSDIQSGASLVQSNFGFSALGNDKEGPMTFLNG